MATQKTLMEMGFPENKIVQAISACGENTEQAMEWLLAHSAEPGTSSLPNIISNPQTAELGKYDSEMEVVAETNSILGTEIKEATESKLDSKHENENIDMEIKESLEVETNNSSEENTNGVVEEDSKTAKSFKCDECQKLFNSSEEVEFHAVKSGHSSFSESTEEKKPLTEEEKKQKLKDLEDKMRLRRKQKEEEDRREAIEREKKRIQISKDITESKRLMAEKEMKQIAEQRRKEKLEDKLARQKVKDQIERDKVARKEMFGGGAVKPLSSSSHIPPSITSPQQQSIQKKEYDSTRLQIRLPSGPPLIQEFKVKEPLSAVRLWVGLNRTDKMMDEGSFTLSTTFPRKTFSDEDMDKPLTILELVPSAVLIVNDC